MTNLTTGHEIPATGLKGLTQNWRADLLAAISVSLVALPLALGVAVASGVEPIAGLISAIVGGIVVTLYRGSHLAINGPAAGLIAVILSAIASLDDGSGNAFNYVLAATVVAGGIQVLLGIFRLGFIAESIPSSVITGIMVAIGVIIFTSQIYVATGIKSIEGNRKAYWNIGSYWRIQPIHFDYICNWHFDVDHSTQDAV
jgi:MFS superfamily sulfate permease-like transporter